MGQTNEKSPFFSNLYRLVMDVLSKLEYSRRFETATAVILECSQAGFLAPAETQELLFLVDFSRYALNATKKKLVKIDGEWEASIFLGCQEISMAFQSFSDASAALGTCAR